MFGKVFASMWDGSMYGHTDAQLVFIFMLANCDEHGVFDMTQERIAGPLGMDSTRVRDAIAYLESPDERSRTPDEDGRRIALMDSHRDWGWRIVNYAKYRDIRNREERREQNRLAQANRRASADVSSRQHVSSPVSKRQRPSAMSAKAEVEAEADRESSLRSDSDCLLSQTENLEAKANYDSTGSYRDVAKWIGQFPREASDLRQLAGFLVSTGTEHPPSVIAVLEHYRNKRPKNPRAYYSQTKNHRDAIILRAAADRAEREHERQKQETR